MERVVVDRTMIVHIQSGSHHPARRLSQNTLLGIIVLLFQPSVALRIPKGLTCLGFWVTDAFKVFQN